MSERIHKFDWDEARRRHAGGETYAQLARVYGVSYQAVQYACDEKRREQVRRMSALRQRSGFCRDCGAPGCVPAALVDGVRRHGRCRSCATKAATTSVRETTLWCFNCSEWKQDAGFPGNRSMQRRRFRHTQCRTCQTWAKRSWRERNREKDRATNREYARARREKS